MEFFNTIENSKLNVRNLKELLSIKNLPILCHSIHTIISDEQKNGIIYCLWGEFEINREDIRSGIRFSLPNCPNALVWSITMDDDSDNIIIHCTINKSRHEDDFIDSIEEFMNDWDLII
ncbi:MAG: hypothetical protein OQL19_13805 [Gammaproteobacteria bacterium]|nr:hypothetical protein [Gammaproteobacteria bacterium]